MLLVQRLKSEKLHRDTVTIRHPKRDSRLNVWSIKQPNSTAIFHWPVLSKKQPNTHDEDPTMSVQEAMMESGIFEDLQRKIDEDSQVKDVSDRRS